MALAGPVFLLWPRTSLIGQPVETLPDPRKSAVEVQGAASCSSVACHNFNGAKGSARSEFSTWAGDDKHSKAFSVLHNDRSTRIVRNLYGDKAKHATEQALC